MAHLDSNLAQGKGTGTPVFFGARIAGILVLDGIRC